MFREETVGYPRPWIATSIVVVQRALVALLGNQRLSARGRDGYRDARVAAAPLTTELTGAGIRRMGRSACWPSLTAQSLSAAEPLALHAA